MNCSHVDIGDELKNLKDFSMAMSAKDKGYAIGNSDTIRVAHNSFARQEPFEIEERKATKDDECFHFIAYIPFNGKLYELDGWQGGPIELADCDEETWLPIAREEINKRIALYESKEVRFNLLAVVGDMLEKYNAEADLISLKIKHLSTALDLPFGGLVTGELTEAQKSSLPTEKEQQESLLADLENDIFEIIDKKNEELEKRDNWTKENQRRRHNYVPLVLELLKIMSEKKMLTSLYKEAEEKNIKKLEEEKASKAEAKPETKA
jgi:ubiquitin carboxyl-terminal hydrolase L5